MAIHTTKNIKEHKKENKKINTEHNTTIHVRYKIWLSQQKVISLSTNPIFPTHANLTLKDKACRKVFPGSDSVKISKQAFKTTAYFGLYAAF